MTRRIHTIDCEYLGRPKVAAAYLVEDAKRAAFVDNNTVHAVPLMLDALKAVGLSTEQVELLIITHVHLDHAGGTAELLRHCPNARVVAHPRAARHVIDPGKLVASASAVYGDEQFRELYGEIRPIPESRVQTMEDGETLPFGDGELLFLHTRGHANHHFCVHDPATASMFTGDAFGLVYPALQTEGTFALPSTTPTDFDGPAARAAIRRIIDMGAERLFPTHFGEVRSIEAAAAQLIRHLHFAEDLVAEAVDGGQPDEALQAYCEYRLRDYLQGFLDGHGTLGQDPDTWKFLEMDIELNAQGLAFAARRQRARE
ncbi:MAG: MBL fold metallo-hydrolase [Xanthomonadales bacterium]|nr:MBL fold metallo-hydrolase [Xanthomonadales bacterium]